MSIKALNWATEIYVGDGVAKSVLRAIANYADENGHCFPSHRRLALDTEFSPDTVKRRIAQLEQWGFLVSFRCWMDENGVRNKEERGRETSRELRLALNKTPEHPSESGDEERSESHGMGGADSTPQHVAPPTQAAPLGMHVAPPPHAGVLPPNEPSLNHKIPPSPPRGEASAPSAERESEPEHFAEFWQGYPNHEVMATIRPKTLEVFRSLSEAEREHARAAVLLLADQLRKLGRKPKNAHLWLQAKGWQEYPNARLGAAPAAVPDVLWYAEGSTEAKALAIAHALVGEALPEPRYFDQAPDPSVRWFKRFRPIGADLLRLAEFEPAQIETFDVVKEGDGDCAAWRDRLARWIGHEVKVRRIWLEPFDAAVHGLSASNPRYKLRKHVSGLRVPWPWPPRKDGSIGEEVAA